MDAIKRVSTFFECDPRTDGVLSSALYCACNYTYAGTRRLILPGALIFTLYFRQRCGRQEKDF
jgi:hypothetical protein